MAGLVSVQKIINQHVKLKKILFMETDMVLASV